MAGQAVTLYTSDGVEVTSLAAGTAFDSGSVSVTGGGGLITLATVVCSGAGEVAFTVENTGDTNALTDFQVFLQASSTSTPVAYLGATDYATVGHVNIPFCTTVVPNTLAAAGTSTLRIKTGAAYAVVFKASATTTTTATVVGNVR